MTSSTVKQLLAASAQKYPNLPAIYNPDSKTSLTYPELLKVVDGKSGWLCAHAGAGRRIAVLEESGFELTLLLLAVMFRHVVVPVNPKLSNDEVLKLLKLTKCEYIISNSMTVRATNLASESDVDFIELAGAETETLEPSQPALDPTGGDVAAVLLTSGSTGTPKVVPLSQGNITYSAMEVAESLSLSPGDRTLALWAQFHIGGLVDLLLAPLATGGEVITGGRFTLGKFRQMCRDLRPDWIQVVPTTLNEIHQHYLNHKEDLGEITSLRFFRCVAAPLDPDKLEAVESDLECLVIHTYGMTEASPLISSTPLDKTNRVRGSVGRADPSRVQILDLSGQKVPSEVDGTIFIRGLNVFSGYESNAPEESHDFVGDWFNTGDIGRLDAKGNLFVVGRNKNMINRGGEKINLTEVEEIIKKHPNVMDAAVFSSPHPTLGDIPVVAIVQRGEITLALLKTYLSGRLAAYKHPEDLFIMKHLPLGAIGKIDRIEIKRQYDLMRLPQVQNPTDAHTRELLLDEISSIWSAVLGVPVASNDTPFVAAGGDSLSALRVALKIEETFGISLSESELARLSTVREFADFLGLKKINLGVLSKVNSHPQIKSAFYLRPQIKSPDEGLRLLNQEGTQLSRNNLVAAMLNSFTPSEVNQLLLGSQPGWEINWRRLLPSGNPRLGKKTATPLTSNDWSREVKSEFVNLYTRHGDPASTEAIIAFTGHAHRLMLPISLILSSLPPEIKWVLLVSDPSRSWFVQGVPGLASSLADLGVATQNLLPDEAKHRVSTLGSSSGSLAALVAGHRLGAASIGLISPKYEKHLAAHLHLLTPIGGRTLRATPLKAVSGLVLKDLQSVAELALLRGGIGIRLVRTFSHNTTMFTAMNEGRASKLLSWLTLTRPSFENLYPEAKSQ